MNSDQNRRSNDSRKTYDPEKDKGSLGFGSCPDNYNFSHGKKNKRVKEKQK